MDELSETAPAFVEMAHRIVWASVATVGPDERPRSRVLHPIWEWDGERLTGWVATGPTPLKVEHLEHSLARVQQIQGPRARYKGLRKNTLDARRIAAVINLQRVARLPVAA